MGGSRMGLEISRPYKNALIRGHLIKALLVLAFRFFIGTGAFHAIAAASRGIITTAQVTHFTDIRYTVSTNLIADIVSLLFRQICRRVLLRIPALGSVLGASGT